MQDKAIEILNSHRIDGDFHASRRMRMAADDNCWLRQRGPRTLFPNLEYKSEACEVAFRQTHIDCGRRGAERLGQLTAVYAAAHATEVI